MPTQAYLSFLDTLKISKELIRIETKNFSASPKNEELIGVEGLRGGCAVLMVAGFEAYLKDLFLEVMGILTDDKTIDFQKLPERLRIQSVFESLGRALVGPKYVKTQKKDRLQGIRIACSYVIDKEINPEVFAETNSNPSASTVKAMFKVVGVNDVFTLIKPGFEKRSAWGKPVAARFIPDKLDEIVRRRHGVAHTAQALSVARNDLRDAIRFLTVLGWQLDMCLRNHVALIKRCAKRSSS